MGGVEAARAGLGVGAAMQQLELERSSSAQHPQAAQLSPYGEAQDGGSTQLLMLRWWPDLAGSWIFYTTLPLWPGVTPRFERIARFAPVIGVFIGGAQAALWLVGRELGVPSASCALLVLVLGLWLTGGLHLDGAMDTGDGLAAGPRCWPSPGSPISGPKAVVAFTG